MGLRQRRVKSRGSGEDDEGGASMPDHDESEDAGTRRPLLEGDGERQGEGEGEGERGSGALLVREPVHWLLRLCSFFGSLLRSIFGVATGKVSPSITLTPRQEHAVYTVLGSAVCKTYDEADVSHVDRLRKLWRASLGSEEPFPSGAGGSIRSERWKDMGWQGVDPGTDIRGGGIMGLDNLIYLSQKYPGVYMKLMEKASPLAAEETRTAVAVLEISSLNLPALNPFMIGTLSEGLRSDWEYPFSAAGMNVTFMLVDIFGLRPSPSQKATSSGAQKYNKPTLRALIEVEREFNDILVAFHEVYCVAFEMLDNQWLEQKASYLQFNDVLKNTKENLERALSNQSVKCVSDLRRVSGCIY